MRKAADGSSAGHETGDSVREQRLDSGVARQEAFARSSQISELEKRFSLSWKSAFRSEIHACFIGLCMLGLVPGAERHAIVIYVAVSFEFIDASVDDSVIATRGAQKRVRVRQWSKAMCRYNIYST